MNTGVILALVVAAIGAGGGWLAGINGLFTLRLNRKKDETATQVEKYKEEREAFNVVVTQALSTMAFMDNQLKDVRALSAASEQHQAAENQALRERIRMLEMRVSELELENARLKSVKRRPRSGKTPASTPPPPQ